MPSGPAMSMLAFVIWISARDGVGSPEGWLCTSKLKGNSYSRTTSCVNVENNWGMGQGQIHMLNRDEPSQARGVFVGNRQSHQITDSESTSILVVQKFRNGPPRQRDTCIINATIVAIRMRHDSETPARWPQCPQQGGGFRRRGSPAGRTRTRGGHHDRNRRARRDGRDQPL